MRWVLVLSAADKPRSTGHPQRFRLAQHCLRVLSMRRIWTTAMRTPKTQRSVAVRIGSSAVEGALPPSRSVPGTLELCVGPIVLIRLSAVDKPLISGAPPNVSGSAALRGCAVDGQDGDEGAEDNEGDVDEDHEEGEADEDEEVSRCRSIVRVIAGR